MNHLRGSRGLNYGDYAYIENFIQDGWTTFPLPNIPRREQHFEIWLRPVPAAEQPVRAARGAVRDRQADPRRHPRSPASRRPRPSWPTTPTSGPRTCRAASATPSTRVLTGKDLVKELQARLPKMTKADVDKAVRKHLSLNGLGIAIVADHGQALADKLAQRRVRRPSPTTRPARRPTSWPRTRSSRSSRCPSTRTPSRSCRSSRCSRSSVVVDGELLIARIRIELQRPAASGAREQPVRGDAQDDAPVASVLMEAAQLCLAPLGDQIRRLEPDESAAPGTGERRELSRPGLDLAIRVQQEQRETHEGGARDDEDHSDGARHGWRRRPRISRSRSTPSRTATRRR